MRSKQPMPVERWLWMAFLSISAIPCSTAAGVLGERLEAAFNVFEQSSACSTCGTGDVDGDGVLDLLAVLPNATGLYRGPSLGLRNWQGEARTVPLSCSRKMSSLSESALVMARQREPLSPVRSQPCALVSNGLVRSADAGVVATATPRRSATQERNGATTREPIQTGSAKRRAFMALASREVCG